MTDIVFLSDTQYTNDYSKFVFARWNRPIVQQNIKNRMKDLKQYGWWSIQPALIFTDGEVLDAQHRIEAAKILSMAVPYRIVADPVNMTRAELAQLINKGRQWSIADMINAIASENNNQSIVYINQLMHQYCVAGIPKNQKLLKTDLYACCGLNPKKSKGELSLIVLKYDKSEIEKNIRFALDVKDKFDAGRRFYLLFAFELMHYNIATQRQIRRWFCDYAAKLPRVDTIKDAAHFLNEEVKKNDLVSGLFAQLKKAKEQELEDTSNAN